MTFPEPTGTAAPTGAFPHLPFALRHRFTDHLLLTPPKLAALAQALPRDLIETAGAWMVLKHIETVPAYGKLIEDALTDIARARGFSSRAEAGFDEIGGFIFVSSAASTTPFHADGDEQFFFQIRGDRLFHVYDNRDRTIASEEALEDCVVKHRNLHYQAKFDTQCTTYRLTPGDGVFVPYQWPHWTRTGDSYSIALALTWTSDEARRRNDLLAVNAMLRSLGFTPRPPGFHPALDAAKAALFRTAAGALTSLRRGEPMRQAIRRLASSRGANFRYEISQPPP